MRRRLDLGTSLVGAPQLLLLDEPTTGLDPGSRIDLWDAIRGLASQGTDVLLTTQYLDEADHLADRVAIIDHGRVIAQGTPAELKRQFGYSMLEVYVPDRHNLTAVAQALAGLDHHQPHADPATRRVSTALPDSPGELATCLHALAAIGVNADDIALRPATLDEVFLTITGGPASGNGARPHPVSHR